MTYSIDGVFRRVVPQAIIEAPQPFARSAPLPFAWLDARLAQAKADGDVREADPRATRHTGWR